MALGCCAPEQGCRIVPQHLRGSTRGQRTPAGCSACQGSCWQQSCCFPAPPLWAVQENKPPLLGPKSVEGWKVLLEPAGALEEGPGTAWCPPWRAGARGWRQTRPWVEIVFLHALLCLLLGLTPAQTKALVSGFWFIKRYKSFSAEKHSSAQAWDLYPLPGCDVQPPQGNSCPQAGSGIQGSLDTKGPLFQVAEACQGARRELLGPLCTAAQKQKQAYQRDCIVYCNLHFLVQFLKQVICFPPE